MVFGVLHFAVFVFFEELDNVEISNLETGIYACRVVGCDREYWYSGWAIEQQSLYAQFDFTMPVNETRLPDPVNATGGMFLKGVLVPSYKCPSDINEPISPGRNQIQPSNYHPSMGPSAQIANNAACSCPLFSTFRSFS